MRALIAITILCATAVSPMAQTIHSSVDPGGLADKKVTGLALYLTPEEADAALGADPSIVFVDVRDPIEINYVGHPEGIDAIVPFQTAGPDFDAGAGRYAMSENMDFVSQIAQLMEREGRSPDDPVFLICRSGSRSARAADLLAAEGYSNVWNLVEGFEGDKDDEGRRSVNGWRNAGLPWTTRIGPEQAWPQE